LSTVEFSELLVSGLASNLRARWWAYHERRWAKLAPPTRMDELLRAEANPYGAARVLDRLLLPEFARFGARTHAELATSPPAREYGISSAAVAGWMEAARRRRLIARCADESDACGRRLSETEWELTPAGVTAGQRVRWRVLIGSGGKGMRWVVGLATVGFPAVRYVFGDGVVPEPGVLEDIHLADMLDSLVGATLMSMLVGGLIGGLMVVLLLPWTQAGRRRHWVANASRLLERESRWAEEEPEAAVAAAG
jgi:hypothetical protein